MNVFKLNHLSMNSVALNNDGIDISRYEESVKHTKLSYLIPDFQNPTGTTYSYDKRKNVANIIAKNNTLLIEDSPYTKLFFEEEFSSISKLIPNQSFHLGSFSKSLAPALRIGWIRANKQLLQPLIAYKEAMDLHTNGLTQHILSRYLEDGDSYWKHLKSLRISYSDKMEYFSLMLERYLPGFIYTKPKGGMFIYGRFDKINTSYLLQKCLKRGVLFVPGNEFYLDNDSSSEIRFNFTHASKNEIKIGLKIIKSIIDEQL